MTALTQPRMSLIERWTHHLFTLAIGNKAWRGGMACIDVSTGLCEPGHVEADLVYIGKFDEDVDATAAPKPVNVDLGVEIEVVWWNNDTVAPVLANMLLLNCSILDDQTVSADPTGRSVAGRVWAVDAVKGVAVQKTIFTPAPVVELAARGDADRGTGGGRTGPGVDDKPIPPSSGVMPVERGPGGGGRTGPGVDDKPIPPSSGVMPGDRGPSKGSR